jgi:DNA-binding MarR family transcriptional regulator
VSKRDDPVDSRATLFALTPKGEAAADALNDVTLRRVARALAEVSDPADFAARMRRFTVALLAEE